MIATKNIPGPRRGEAKAQRNKAKSFLRLFVSGSKLFALTALLFVFAVAQAQPQPGASDPFGSRRAEAEAAHDGHRAKLFVELARDEMEAADKAFTSGNVELGQKLAGQAGTDADAASKAAVDSGKRLKDTEIDLRKLQIRTRDIGRSLNFEDRPPIDKIVNRIEALREVILNRIFGGKKGKS